ncbi:MAG: cobalamin biosynthesis protein CbiM [Gammaproteobacteria bacterium HGW-Gammaproteobacteria-8]|nr:MAG: cobalamin biosynthesis protein CbiM [Gammaproteobacteria bacterium HGW-Gammaproteobacteria-8]
MHISDGLIAPPAYVAATLLVAPFWALALRKLLQRFDERLIPRLAVMTALAFVLSTIMIPLPGGTSAHLIGIGLLVIACGFWAAFLAFSLVLLLQALLFGAGGVTALPINALCMGLVGGAVIALGHGLLARKLGGTRWSSLAGLLPVTVGIAVAALMIAVVLGIQPRLGQDDTGQPLYFPFGFAVTIPVIVLPHLLIGVIEALLTAAVLTSLPTRRLAT